MTLVSGSQVAVLENRVPSYKLLRGVVRHPNDLSENLSPE